MLYIIATPVGNMDDITLRALKTLGEIDILACEDTRRTRKIYEVHQISPPKKIISYREDNEKNAVKGILKLLNDGLTVGMCSDAGYPGISDPGYRLVSEAVQNGVEITVIPGASSIIPALILSGLPSDSFTFKGFPPKKPGKMRKFLEIDMESEKSLIFFESPYRIGKFLKAAYEVYGDRDAAVCIELTKKFERVSRGKISELAADFAEGKVKGEIVVVIAGIRD
ncbi:MAG TPA: 16S rRNA (cytidine(1402)-2'-O)-methyltransferase [bacterium]|jgi:16S rRNA (cytidine1402-2'-O)-methyltransferase